MSKCIVTIIIATYNVASSLEKTIQSILSQTYPDIEIIVIDGGSTDGTVDILKKFQEKIAYWVSEPDKGISDAFNKGVQKATGTYINFQGAGDIFVSDTVIEQMMEGVQSDHDQLVCGRIQRAKGDGTILFTTKPVFKKKSLLFRMSLPHQALFTSKLFFETYGLFDVNNRYCMDYELLLRAYRTLPAVVMKDVLVSAWQDGGIGTGRLLEVYREYDMIKRKHGVAPTWILSTIHRWILLKFYTKIIIKKIYE
jgi:glycosyltransferase involved in cell wall biosynthesis